MSTSKRSAILELMASRATDLFGPAGSNRPIFRKIRRGPWNPEFDMAPNLTVLDAGRKRVPNQDGESIEYLLAIQFVLELQEDWSRESKFGDWSENVDAIALAFHNWNAGTCGILHIKYEQDEPFEVVLESGGSSGKIWLIDFEIEYFEPALDLFNNEGE